MTDRNAKARASLAFVVSHPCRKSASRMGHPRLWLGRRKQRLDYPVRLWSGRRKHDWTTRLSAWLTFGGGAKSHLQPFQALQVREKCTRLQDDVDAWYFPICCDCFCRDGSGGCFCAFCADG